MPKYEIEVCRIGYAVRTIEIEAENASDAAAKALESAGNYDFNEHTSEYDINYVQLEETEA